MKRHTAAGRLGRLVGRKAHEGRRNGTGTRLALVRFLAEYPTLLMAHTPPPSLTTRPGDVSAADTPSVLRRPLAVTNASRRMDHNHHSLSAYEDMNTEPEHLCGCVH